MSSPGGYLLAICRHPLAFPGVDTWRRHFNYRGRSKCRRQVSTPLALFLLRILRIRPGQPDVSDVADLPDRDKLFLFSPVECPLELGIPELPLLLGGALRRRAGVEGFADPLLIDHPHRWAIRRDGQ